MNITNVFLYFISLKDNYYITSPLTLSKVRTMHRHGKLAEYIDKVQNAYTRLHIKNQRQALEILKVRFHNQNQIGALNEELTKEQESNPGYSFSCCIGSSVNTSWTSVCRSITTVNSTTAGYVRDTYQVIEIDKTEDGETIFAVLEQKDPRAEYAHNLFWAYYVNNEYQRARAMALGMRPVWKGQLSEYYGRMYCRLLYK